MTPSPVEVKIRKFVVRSEDKYILSWNAPVPAELVRKLLCYYDELPVTGGK